MSIETNPMPSAEFLNSFEFSSDLRQNRIFLEVMEVLERKNLLYQKGMKDVVTLFEQQKGGLLHYFLHQLTTNEALTTHVFRKLRSVLLVGIPRHITWFSRLDLSVLKELPWTQDQILELLTFAVGAGHLHPLLVRAGVLYLAAQYPSIDVTKIAEDQPLSLFILISALPTSLFQEATLRKIPEILTSPFQRMIESYGFFTFCPEGFSECLVLFLMSDSSEAVPQKKALELEKLLRELKRQKLNFLGLAGTLEHLFTQGALTFKNAVGLCRLLTKNRIVSTEILTEPMGWHALNKAQSMNLINLSSKFDQVFSQNEELMKRLREVENKIEALFALEPAILAACEAMERAGEVLAKLEQQQSSRRVAEAPLENQDPRPTKRARHEEASTSESGVFGETSRQSSKGVALEGSPSKRLSE